MEKRSRRRTRDLVTQAAFQGLSENEIGCARISMMARSTNAPCKGRIQKRKTTLHLFKSGLQRTAGRYKRATTGLMRRSKLVAGKPLKCELPFARPRQYDFELGEKPWLRLDLMAASVLFYDDVVAHRQAKSGTFARGFRCEERVEYFLFDRFRDAVP